MSRFGQWLLTAMAGIALFLGGVLAAPSAQAEATPPPSTPAATATSGEHDDVGLSVGSQYCKFFGEWTGGPPLEKPEDYTLYVVPGLTKPRQELEMPFWDLELNEGYYEFIGYLKRADGTLEEVARTDGIVPPPPVCPVVNPSSTVTATSTSTVTTTATATSTPTQAATATSSPTATVTSTATSSPTKTATTQPSTTTAPPTTPPATTPAPPKDVYTTPGYHTVNGRRWHTTVEPYSQTVRYRTEIWADQVVYVKGHFVKKSGWAFNNLTYAASPRSLWQGNPLAKTGSWTATDGRKWRTECDTARSGRNGCRNYAVARVVEQTKRGGKWSYKVVSKEVFNGIVLFSRS